MLRVRLTRRIAADSTNDVGAGTGLSYALLREAVGEEGRVLGFEQSPEMFERARARVQTARSLADQQRRDEALAELAKAEAICADDAEAVALGKELRASSLPK